MNAYFSSLRTSARSEGGVQIPPPPNLLLYKHWDWINRCVCLADVQDTSPCRESNSSPLLVILSPHWHRIAPSVLRLCAGLMTCANTLSETAIARKLGRLASCRTAKEDARRNGARRGSGSHRWGSCDLANRSSESEPKTSPSFPVVRSGVPATPGAPPEVFVGARMELRAAILGLFYIRIESRGKTILTDFLVGSSAICRFSADVCWVNNTSGIKGFGSNNKVCILGIQNLLPLSFLPHNFLYVDLPSVDFWWLAYWGVWTCLLSSFQWLAFINFKCPVCRI